jgi:transcriptional regulator with XRE-family HTH domain
MLHDVSSARLPRHAQPERVAARRVLGERLAAVARFRGLTRDDLAQACGVSVLTISNWFKGDGEPGALDLRSLAARLEVSAAALLGDAPLVLSTESGE